MIRAVYLKGILNVLKRMEKDGRINPTIYQMSIMIYDRELHENYLPIQAGFLNQPAEGQRGRFC
jgi:hypothetical protein